MIKHLKQSWGRFKAGLPGRRFQQQFRLRQRFRSGAARKALFMVAGILIAAAGIYAMSEVKLRRTYDARGTSGVAELVELEIDGRHLSAGRRRARMIDEAHPAETAFWSSAWLSSKRVRASP